MKLARAAGFMSSIFGCGEGSAIQGYCSEAELQRKAAISDARTRAADTLKRRRDFEGKITTGNEPRTRVMDLPWIENQCCKIACYILCYIIHAILNAI